MTLVQLPFGWDESAHPLLDEGGLRQNKIYCTARTVLHELIHEQTRFYPREMFETAVYELLTDSLTEYIQLQARGMDFKGENFEH